MAGRVADGTPSGERTWAALPGGSGRFPAGDGAGAGLVTDGGGGSAAADGVGRAGERVGAVRAAAGRLVMGGAVGVGLSVGVGRCRVMTLRMGDPVRRARAGRGAGDTGQ
ncbi:hypothetical protein GCM10010297_66630 [Streptomyces malachitofuscus]|nr:hypothetical protein GCM10010297_66630 [Streptomyces malachitofuscus]